MTISYFAFYRYSYEDIEDVASKILSRTTQRPTIAIVCGTGLGGIVNALEDTTDVPYSEINGFPVSTGFILFCLTYIQIHVCTTQV